MSALQQRLAQQLEQIRAQDLYRRRRVVEGGHSVALTVDGQRCINFCSNDYLGLATDPRVIEAARAAYRRCGAGSGASALVSGYNAEHRALEEELADFVGRARALLFSTGWAANLGVLRGLLRRGDRLLADELNHASLIDGGRLSGADYQRIPHASLPAYAEALSDPTAAFSLVATDSVFSMDGDLAPLAPLAELCARRDAALMVDDAHGFGVLGAHGRGALELLGLGETQVPIYVATLGKSVGVAGAFVAGSDDLIEFMIQRARSWIFSTAPPPAVAAAARAGLRCIATEPERRARLFQNIEQFRKGAEQLGMPIGVPGSDHRVATPIQALLLGSPAKTLQLSQYLLSQGYWVAGIRPPTVPRGTSRLRITLSAAHTPQQVSGLLDALSRGLREPAVTQAEAAV